MLKGRLSSAISHSQDINIEKELTASKQDTPQLEQPCSILSRSNLVAEEG